MECGKIESAIGDPWYFCPTSPNPGCTETFEIMTDDGENFLREWEMKCEDKSVAWFII